MEEEELARLKERIEKRGRKIDDVNRQLDDLDQSELEHHEHEERWQELWDQKQNLFDDLIVDKLPELDNSEVIELIHKQSKRIGIEFRESGADEEYAYLYELWRQLARVIKEAKEELD